MSADRSTRAGPALTDYEPDARLTNPASATCTFDSIPLRAQERLYCKGDERGPLLVRPSKDRFCYSAQRAPRFL